MSMKIFLKRVDIKNGLKEEKNLCFEIFSLENKPVSNLRVSRELFQSMD